MIFASLCQGKLWVSSLLTRTGAATQPGHANPTYLLNGYRRLVPGTLEIKKNKKKKPLILDKKPERARERMKILLLNVLIHKDSYKLVQLLVTAPRSPFKTRR